MGNIYNSCRLPLRMKLAGMLLMGSISMGYGITERRQSASLFIVFTTDYYSIFYR